MLIVEDGSGKSDAESYISVAEYLAYHAKFGVVPPEDTKATVSLHIAIQPTDTDTVTIDGKTYTFQTTLTDVDGNVKIGTTLAFSQANLQAAINLNIDQAEDAASYADSMTKHLSVDAGAIASSAIPITAQVGGTDGNALASTTSFTDELNHFESATLLGGVSSRENALRDGAQYLDSEYEDQWRGKRKNRTQALAHPRFNILDNDNFLFDSDSVAQPVKDAQAEMSLKSQTETLIPDLANSGSVKRTKDELGPLKTEVEYTGGNSPIKVFRKVELLLNRVTFPPGIIRRA